MPYLNEVAAPNAQVANPVREPHMCLWHYGRNGNEVRAWTHELNGVHYCNECFVLHKCAICEARGETGPLNSLKNMGINRDCNHHFCAECLTELYDMFENASVCFQRMVKCPYCNTNIWTLCEYQDTFNQEYDEDDEEDNEHGNDDEDVDMD